MQPFLSSFLAGHFTDLFTGPFAGLFAGLPLSEATVWRYPDAGLP
jgi:hypothetical protein